MTTYAVAILNDINVGPAIGEYLERIDASLEPFDGHFIVHGAEADMREGDNPGTLVVVEFPDRRSAEEWYDSPAYQAILPLRTENTRSVAFLIDGVDRSHVATDALRGR